MIDTIISFCLLALAVLIVTLGIPGLMIAAVSIGCMLAGIALLSAWMTGRRAHG